MGGGWDIPESGTHKIQFHDELTYLQSSRYLRHISRGPRNRRAMATEVPCSQRGCLLPLSGLERGFQ